MNNIFHPENVCFFITSTATLFGRITMLTNGNRKDVVFLSCQQNTDNEDPEVKVELTWYGLPFAETDMWSPT